VAEGEAERLAHAVARDWRAAPLSEADRALCAHAAKLTHHMAATGPEDLDALRDAGFDDVAIHDATQVIAYFHYITRIAESLGVEPESEIPAYGETTDTRDSP
jgi:uncharacterized peroxidase-related enzyme